MANTYSTTNLGSARSALSARLSDPANIYWKVPELNSLIVEALRTYQALTGFYRERVTWDTVASTDNSSTAAFYDLTAVAAAQYGFTVTDQSIITQIESMLLESTAIPYNGTSMFSGAAIDNAVQNRMNQFLLDTGCVVEVNLVNGPTAPNSRLVLPDTLISLIRLAWQDNLTELWTTLWRTDEYALNGYTRAWVTTSDIPTSYSIASAPPVTLQLAPRPIRTGSVQYIAVSDGPILNPQVSATIMPVLDDWTTYVKWGALADLLAMDGQVRDFERSQYCEQRYQEGVQACRIYPSLTNILLNGQVIPTGSLMEMDGYMASWQSTTGQDPQIVSMAGKNLVVVGPVPNAVYSVTGDLVRSMPVPVIDADFLQVGSEVLDTVLDYAQHLACFKMGGSEFNSTLQLYQNFLRSCAGQNDRLRQCDFYKIALDQPGLRQQYQTPTRANATIT